MVNESYAPPPNVLPEFDGDIKPIGIKLDFDDPSVPNVGIITFTIPKFSDGDEEEVTLKVSNYDTTYTEYNEATRTFRFDKSKMT